MSVRAAVLARRTYNRPKDDGTYETWSETIDRVIRHQAWLWARARRHPTPMDVFNTSTGGSVDDARRVLPEDACRELAELRTLMLDRAALVAGRTLWLGGTDTARRRESSQFNCAFLEIETVFDFVDAFWLLLQGCGVGFKPVPGCLHGFATYIPRLTIVASARECRGGDEQNREMYDADARQWRIVIGDSAEAWAKSLGKLLAGKYHGCGELILDFGQIRPPGSIIEGYGWTCQGYAALSDAYRKIFQILNRHAGQMLPFAAIHDIMNLVGTVLSSRRSAQMAIRDYDKDWRQFAAFKYDHFRRHVNQTWREQSNNTLDFQVQPGRSELEELLEVIVRWGGSEPGLRNAAAARCRAPWSRGTNPCGEILLPNRGFCNLCEINLAHPHHEDFDDLMRTLWLMARANFRQTCVDLQDGILQRAWHENNENLRLCGVGLTGIVQRDDLTCDTLQVMRNQARQGAFSMADELGMTRPAAVTTVKPSGTLSKIMECTEGMHRPPGRHLFNHVEFSPLSSMPQEMAKAGYLVQDHPTKRDAVVVRFPVQWQNVAFERLDNGREGDLESAVKQLERYRMLLNYWSDHNVSCTISYVSSELPEMIDWFERHWDEVVGVAFLLRGYPDEKDDDMGYAFMPQEVVTKQEHDSYASSLRDFDLSCGDDESLEDIDCPSGECPAR